MRTITFRFRLTEAERSELAAKADAAGLSDSDYVRQKLGMKVNHHPPLRPESLLRHFAREDARRDVEPGLAALEALSKKLGRR